MRRGPDCLDASPVPLTARAPLDRRMKQGDSLWTRSQFLARLGWEGVAVRTLGEQITRTFSGQAALKAAAIIV